MIKMIVAITEDGGIGNNGDLLFKIPDDMKRFKRLTTYNNTESVNNIVLMGRKTFESLPSKLVNRTNIVLSSNTDLYCFDLNIHFITEYDSLLSIHKKFNNQGHDIWIIGGGELYNQTIQYVDEIYITKIKTTVPCDTYFPIDKLDEFVSIKTGEGNHEGLEYEYYTYYRNYVQ